MMNTRTFLATLSILLPAAHLAGDSIQLKRSTRMKHADERITLGDIATIEGEYAGRFASVVVDRMVDPTRPAEVTLEAVIYLAVEETQAHLMLAEVMMLEAEEA